MCARFWIVGTEDGPDAILESDERPRTVTDGGVFTRVGPGYETLEQLNTAVGMTVLCRECKHLIYTGYFKSVVDRMLALQLCFRCLHWTDILTEKEKLQHVVVNHTRYWIEPDKPSSYQGFLGFGGAKFEIAFHDGRKVTSRNLWCQGHIPENFRERLPDNAVFLPNSGTDRSGYIGPGSVEASR